MTMNLVLVGAETYACVKGMFKRNATVTVSDEVGKFLLGVVDDNHVRYFMTADQATQKNHAVLPPVAAMEVGTPRILSPEADAEPVVNTVPTIMHANPEDVVADDEVDADAILAEVLSDDAVTAAEVAAKKKAAAEAAAVKAAEEAAKPPVKKHQANKGKAVAV